VLDGRLGVSQHRRAAGLVGTEVGEVLGLWVGAEEPAGEIEVGPGLLRAVLPHEDRPAEQVCPRQVEGVVGGVEQGDRTAHVVKRHGRTTLDPGQAGQRPIEPDARIRVPQRLGLVEDAVEDRLCALEVAEVGEGVAEVGREPDARGDVVRRMLGDVGQAALEDVDGLVGPPARRVGPPEAREHVGPRGRRERRELQAGFEALDRLGVAAGRRRGQAEGHAGAGGRDRVTGRERLFVQLLELLRGFVGRLRQPQLELGVGDSELALLDVPDLGAGLEVIGRDAELAGEHAQRLHRGPPGPGLDARDVGVRDSGAGKLALGQPALVAQASQTLADRLGVWFARHRAQS
jgi:hypothetical protein